MDTMGLEKRISTTNEAGLIAILYEALIHNFTNGIRAIDEKDYEKLNKITNHSRDILAELLVQFSGDDEISSNLREINFYINKLITEGGEYEKDSTLFKTSIEILTPYMRRISTIRNKRRTKNGNRPYLW